SWSRFRSLPVTVMVIGLCDRSSCLHRPGSHRDTRRRMSQYRLLRSAGRLDLPGTPTAFAERFAPAERAVPHRTAERLLVRQATGLVRPPNERPPREQRVVAVRAELGEDTAFDADWHEGGVMPPRQAIADAPWQVGSRPGLVEPARIRPAFHHANDRIEA